MTQQIAIHNKHELQQYKQTISMNLIRSVQQLADVLKEESPLHIFQCLKFEKTVTEPLSGKPENLIEVINQSMTYIVSIMSVEYLLDVYPDKSFVINWGNIPGYDIESVDGQVIGECFAATSYSSNQKLAKDLKRLSSNDTASYKYEFFYDKKFTENHRGYYEGKYPEIQIIKFKEIK